MFSRYGYTILLLRGKAAKCRLKEKKETYKNSEK